VNGALQAIAGAALLLGAGVITASVWYVWGLWRDTLHPPRRTMAWALAYGQTAHPEDLGLHAKEQRFPRADGGSTPCWLVQGRAAHSALITIVLHGHGRSRWDSLRRLMPWVEQSALVVLPDLRGHGEALGRTALGRQEGRDVVLLMNELAVLYPGAHFQLVGHSMGAVVAIHAAAQVVECGPPVDRVDAFGPYETVSTPLRARIWVRGLPGGIYPACLLKLARLFHGPEIATSASAARIKSGLTLHADRTDEVSPLRDAQTIARAAPHATLIVTDGVPHADLGVPAPPIPLGQASANSEPQVHSHPS
jgi:pimeloyl-ACP methyl ester carboxylesterase